MPTISLPSVLAPLAGGRNAIDASGNTVGETLDDLTRQFPGLGPRLRDTNGEPYAFVTIYLNDEDIRFVGGFGAAVQPGDELTVVPAVAGG